MYVAHPNLLKGLMVYFSTPSGPWSTHPETQYIAEREDESIGQWKSEEQTRLHEMDGPDSDSDHLSGPNLALEDVNISFFLSFSLSVPLP